MENIMQCGSCDYFAPLPVPADKPDAVVNGECLRYPPVRDAYGVSRNPETRENRYCGEFHNRELTRQGVIFDAPSRE